MAEASEPPAHSPASAADAMALLAEAEAEALAAEAVAEAARARARAARLRREALAMAETVEDYGDAAAAAADADEEAADLEEADEYYDEDDYYDDDYDDESDEGSDETSEAAAPESETNMAAWRRRFPSLSTIAKLAAIAIIGGFAWLSVYMELQHRDATQRQQREAAFVAAAKLGVIYMTSLDFNKARADVQRLIDTTTGEFRDDFQQRADDFASVVAQSKAITEGTVNGAAIESVDGNSAAVLVLATSRITNSPPGKDEPPKTWRLKVTVTDAGGHYKMSKVEYVP